jgi:hypothetical protein
MITWSRRFPIVPLATIVADPLWHRLTREERRQVRSIHAKRLKLARIRRELKR